MEPKKESCCLGLPEWKKKADIISLDRVTPESPRFLWDNRIPLGMLTLLVGDPGMGKSFLSLYMASVTSCGGMWPDGSTCEKGCVLILSAEDPLEYVIRPRLDKLGAQAGNIFAYRSTMHRDSDGNEYASNFNVVHDRQLLEKTLEDNPRIKLVIIDPLSAYFGSADTHKDAAVRSIMSSLFRLAEKYRAAFVCVMHLNKGTASKAVYRTMGSLAFPAAARTVWLVANDPSDSESPRRYLLPAKHNVLRNPTPLSFEIKDNTIVFDNKPVTLTAEDVLCQYKKYPAPEKEKAVVWLRQTLETVDSMPSSEIFKLAKENGISENRLRGAKEELKVKCFLQYDEDGNRAWHWQLIRENRKTKIPGLQGILDRAPKLPYRGA